MFQCQEAKGTTFYRKYVVNLIYQAEDRTTGTYSNSRDENIKVKFMYEKQGLVKGAELCLNPYFFDWLEK